MKNPKVTRYLVERQYDGLYLGHSIWTSDSERATHFKTKKAANEQIKNRSHIKCKAIKITF